MKVLTIKEVIDATEGRLLSCKEDINIEDTHMKDIHFEDIQITGMSFDSRTIKDGYLYVPLIGERVDGHQFIQSAFEKNAGASLFTQSDYKPERLYSDKPYIKVSDAKQAMQAIATTYRRKLTMPIIGVTGSVGKTTTRSMIAFALSAEKEVYQTKGNLNSQLGVPVMIMNVEEEDVVVLEMGISEFGEMDRLTAMVAPDISVITGIGVAHIQQFQTQENICHEKMAITHSMKPDGIVLLNGDDPILCAHKSRLKQKVYLYGTTPDCDFYAKDIQVMDGRCVFTAVCMDELLTVTLPLLGRHNIQNSLAALAVCKCIGVSLTQAANKLNMFTGENKRQQIIQTEQCTIIDDSYNANPDSMKAGLEVLMQFPKKGRSIAVLGDMYELGNDEVRYHKEIGSYAKSLGVDILITIGELAAHMNPKTIHMDTKEDLIAYIKEIVKPEDVVLVKASRAVALEEVVSALCTNSTI